MTLYDQHMHTFLSYDCSEKFENYLAIAQKKGISHLVSTEHLDLSCQITGRDMLVDVKEQEKIIAKLQTKYDVQILKGIELSYKFSRIDDLNLIVQNNKYDVVIMAVHENEFADCTTEAFLQNRSPDEAYSAYLDLYISMLENCACYNIVGHIDYLLRYIYKIDIQKHEEQLTELLKLVIKNDKALEFNTRFLYQHNDDSYLKYIFSLYYALGGRKISLGSDAHFSRHYLGSFEQAVDILKSIGFEYICAYQQGKEVKTPLQI